MSLRHVPIFVRNSYIYIYIEENWNDYKIRIRWIILQHHFLVVQIHMSYTFCWDDIWYNCKIHWYIYIYIYIYVYIHSHVFYLLHHLCIVFYALEHSATGSYRGNGYPWQRAVPEAGMNLGEGLTATGWPGVYNMYIPVEYIEYVCRYIFRTHIMIGMDVIYTLHCFFWKLTSVGFHFPASSSLPPANHVL